MKLLTWNIAHRAEAWRFLLDSDADLAMLQEASTPPEDVRKKIEVDPAPWQTTGAGMHRPWRAAIANLSRQIPVTWIQANSIDTAAPGELAVSRPGSLAAASVTLPTGEDLIVISSYACWEKTHPSTNSHWIYADASVHRIISDISIFIGQQMGHRIIVAGDFNILHGYGEEGSPYWAERYESVFTRMAALGLAFAGPQAPGGRLAHPWPKELPASSENVPTYHSSHQTPATAMRQLDFVFVSCSLAKRVRVAAVNEPEDWGPSDHCRVNIEIE